MFWIFILAIALAVVFIKLGAFSVWVGILKGALQILGLIVMGLLGILFWRKVSGSEKIRNLRMSWPTQPGPQSLDNNE